MEVSTVSPSPASPSERDNVCVIDVTDVAIHSVAVIIGLCGLPGNGAVIGLLRLKLRNASFFYLAVADFLFLLFAVASALLILVEDVSCSPILPLMYTNFIFQLSVVYCYWALYRLMHSNLWSMQNFCKFCCRCHLPLRLEWVVRSVQYWAFFALFILIPSMTFLCPSHQQEHCQAALISVYTIMLLLVAAPMLVSSTVDFIKAKCGPQQHQHARCDIVIVLVLLTVILTIWNFLQLLGYIDVPSQVVFLLTCIHSSIKPFIYFLMGRCTRPCSVESLRLSLQRVFEEAQENTAHSGDPTKDTVI